MGDEASRGILGLAASHAERMRGKPDAVEMTEAMAAARLAVPPDTDTEKDIRLQRRFMELSGQQPHPADHRLSIPTEFRSPGRGEALVRRSGRPDRF